MPGYPARSKWAVSSSFGASAASSNREAMSSVMEDSGISLFSDEYDLSHQDPRILQDVQRALKLKARREARLKSANSSPSSNKSEHASTSSPQSSPLRPVIPPVPFPPPSVPDIRETQSSPTPGQPAAPVAHPVPSSSDEGTTLDWSSIGTDDDRLERRWTMSITKRKDKERPPSNSAVETRETMYAAKIHQIRKKASSTALEQAALISDQLGRRYNILSNSPPSEGVNILQVARWYSSQDEVVKTSLEQAEPLSWLGDSEEEPKCPSRFRGIVDSDIASSRNSLTEHSDEGGRKLRPIIHPAPLSREILFNSCVEVSPLSDTAKPRWCSSFPPVVEPSSMDNTTTTITDPPSALKQLLEDARIRNTVVVSEVHACSSYARLLTTKTDNTVVLDLTVEPAVLGVVSCSATAKWVGHGTSGYFKSQMNKGNRTFYPLFRLVSRSEQSMSTGIGKSHSSID